MTAAGVKSSDCGVLRWSSNGYAGIPENRWERATQGKRAHLNCRARAKGFPELGMLVNGQFEDASYSGNSNPGDDSHSSKYATTSASLAPYAISPVIVSRIARLTRGPQQSGSEWLLLFEALASLDAFALHTQDISPATGRICRHQCPAPKIPCRGGHWLGRHEKT